MFWLQMTEGVLTAYIICTYFSLIDIKLLEVVERHEENHALFISITKEHTMACIGSCSWVLFPQ